MGTEGTHLYGDRAPHNLQYVVLVASDNLTQERVLTGTSNQITVTDNGAGSTFVLSTPQDIHTGATPTFAGITLTAAVNISLTNTVAAGESLIDCHIIQSDDTALTGTLRGAYITASNGDEVATGTIRGAEIKARAGYPGETGANVNVLEGFSISSDAKTYDVTTHRGGEIILDGGAGTSTLAVGLRIANNFQANRATTSYGLQIYRDSFDYTADIQLSSGGLIGGANGHVLVDSSGNIVSAGTAQFGNVGIGHTAHDTHSLYVGASYTDGTVASASQINVFSINSNSATSAGQRALTFYAYAQGSGGSSVAISGIVGEAQNQQTANTWHTCQAASLAVRNTNASDLIYGYGIRNIFIVSGAGNVTQAIDFEAPAPSLSSTGTIINHYGFYAANLGNAKQTNSYAIYVANQSGSSTLNYSIYTGTGAVRFGDDVTTEGTMSLKEQAAANADTAAYGQLWVRNDVPCVLCFTNDAGTDFTVDVTAV